LIVAKVGVLEIAGGASRGQEKREQIMKRGKRLCMSEGTKRLENWGKMKPTSLARRANLERGEALSRATKRERDLRGA